MFDDTTQPSFYEEGSSLFDRALAKSIVAKTLCDMRGAAGREAGLSNKLEPLSRRGAGESRPTCWSPLSEGARGSCALKHAVQRTASTPLKDSPVSLVYIPRPRTRHPRVALRRTQSM
jgi:hypothetical protein